MAAAKEIEIAVQEEILDARQVGSVDKNGVPLITLVVDGAWSKISYKSKYNALSGVAAILGFHTKKVLYLLVYVTNTACTVNAKTLKK